MTDHRYDIVRNYNKLIRDRVPDEIAATGKPYVTHTADDAEYQHKLQEKLKEEVVEYCARRNTQELADILEVIYALAALHGTSRTALEAQRRQLAARRGGFKNRIILDQS